jgi:hypothetical protein
VSVRLLFVCVVAAAAMSLLGVASTASAEPGTNSCWGVVTSQRASTEHDIGAHASAQEEPRAGLGNLAQDLGISVGEVGAFLATVDGLEATHCP